MSKRFATLLTVENNADIKEEYNNSAIRGRIQDRNLNIEIEPMMMLSFYSSPTELRRNTYYIKEVDDINAEHLEYDRLLSIGDIHQRQLKQLRQTKSKRELPT